jgi:hypothetical protein
MDRDEAIKAARDWVKHRKEVRMQLIEAARRQHPHLVTPEMDSRYNEIRKLHQFPSDLSEQRLLELIDNP